MCGCEPGYTCPRCDGTRFDLAYFDTRDDKEREQDMCERLMSRPDFAAPWGETNG